MNREGVVVTSGVTFTIDANLQLATVSETITVTGESPVVDVKQTGVSTTFDTKELQEVPSATDMWAVLQQTPGVRMAGFDVGGSHKSQQTSYDAFGIQLQNIIRNEGVNNTEATCCTGGYYDFYAISEYRVSAQGADVEMSSPGAHVVSTFKSGGNEFSSLTNFDFETGGMVTDNIDDDLESSRRNLGTGQFIQRVPHGPRRTRREGQVLVLRGVQLFQDRQDHLERGPDIATDVGIFNEYTSEDQLAGLAKGPVHRLRPLEPEREALPGSLPDDSRRVHPGSGQLERNLQGGVAEGLVRSPFQHLPRRILRPAVADGAGRRSSDASSPNRSHHATAEGGGLAAFRLRAHEAPEQWSVELLRAPGLGEPRLQIRIRVHRR